MSNFGYTRIGFPRPGPAIAHLLIANVAVFVLNLLLGGRLSAGVDGDGGWFAVSWARLWDGYGLGLLRLCTYQFTHSYGSPMHLLFNMVALYMFGTIVEGALGYRGTIKLYLAGGVVAALVHMLVYGLATGLSVPVVGASGSCFSLLLFAVCVAPRAEFWIFMMFPVQLRFIGFLAVALAAYSLLIELQHGMGGQVSDSAHLGGAGFGYLAWRLGWFRDYGGAPLALATLRQRWQRWRHRQRLQAAQQQEEQLDDILAKVKEQGLQSLSRDERRFLDRIGQKGKKS